MADRFDPGDLLDEDWPHWAALCVNLVLEAERGPLPPTGSDMKWVERAPLRAIPEPEPLVLLCVPRGTTVTTLKR